MPTISVVIPVYNVADYLPQCFNSIGIGQLSTDIEVILVDDGSTDGSGDLCEQFAREYAAVQVLHKTNGGLSDARNYGTQAATGDWIFYLDSDDWLAPQALDRLLEFAVQHDCDVVQGGFFYAFDEHVLFDNHFKEPVVIEQHEAMAELIKDDSIKNFAWGKLYRASIAKEHLFPVGKFYEDSFWQHLIFHDIKRLGILPERLYYYRQRQDSISGLRHTSRLAHLIEGNEQRMVFIKQFYPEFQSLMADRLWLLAYSLNKSHPDLFKTQFERIDRQYRHLLSDRLRHSWRYRLRKNLFSSYDAFDLYQRFINRFKPARYIKLPLA